MSNQFGNERLGYSRLFQAGNEIVAKTVKNFVWFRREVKAIESLEPSAVGREIAISMLV
jgi:hypothetical protein